MGSVASRYAALAKRAQADSQAKAADIQARVDAGEITHEQGMAEGQQFADQIEAGFADVKKDSGPISGLKRITKEIDPAAAIIAPVAYGATAAAGAGAEALGAELPGSIDELTGAAGIEEEADIAAEGALRAEEEARALNIERYGEAKDYMMPWMEDARTARDQQMIELGLAPGERGAYMETGGYQDMLSESQRSVEQAAASGGSLYSGARMKAAGEVGAGVQNQFYNNYMNMLTNIADPSTATNLASLGMGQGATMGRDMMAAQQSASGYRMGGAQAVQAGRGDLFQGITNIAGAFI